MKQMQLIFLEGTMFYTSTFYCLYILNEAQLKFLSFLKFSKILLMSIIGLLNIFVEKYLLKLNYFIPLFKNTII